MATFSSSDPSLGLRERKKLATRRALQRAGLQLASEHGMDVTVEEICAHANVSPRTFFNYFSSKQEALAGEPPAPPSDEHLAVFETGGPTGDLFADLCEVLALHLHDNLPSLREMHQRHALFQHCPALLPQMLHGFAQIERRLTQAVARRLDTSTDDVRAQAHAAVAAALMRLSVRRWAQGDDTQSIDEHVRRAFAALTTT